MDGVSVFWGGSWKKWLILTSHDCAADEEGEMDDEPYITLKSNNTVNQHVRREMSNPTHEYVIYDAYSTMGVFCCLHTTFHHIIAPPRSPTHFSPHSALLLSTVFDKKQRRQINCM
jgi:hypothetical protein